MPTYYSIYSARMARFLMAQGFELQKTITDPIYPNRKIFLFIESPELKKTMSLLPRNH